MDAADGGDGTGPRIVTSRVRSLVFAFAKLICTPSGRRFGARRQSAPATHREVGDVRIPQCDRKGRRDRIGYEPEFAAGREVEQRPVLQDHAVEEVVLGEYPEHLLELATGDEEQLAARSADGPERGYGVLGDYALRRNGAIVVSARARNLIFVLRCLWS